MPQRIRIRKIKTVGFVHAGDDPEAEVVLLKRKPEDAEMDTTESVFKKIIHAVGGALGLDAATVEELSPSGEEEVEMAEYKREDLPQEAQDELAKLEAENAALTAKLEASAEEVVEEEVEAIPEALAKRLDAADARVKAAEDETAKLKAEKRLDEYKAKAAAITLPGWADFGEILMKCADALGEDFEKLEQVLTAADTAIKTGPLFKEIGRVGSGYGSKAEEVDAEVAKIRTADPTLSVEQAKRRVAKQNPKLWNEVLNEVESLKGEGR